MSDWKPKGYNSVSPYLVCTDAEAMLAFIERVFDGQALQRVRRPDGSIMHAEIRIDDTVVMIGVDPNGAAVSSALVHIYVSDVDAVYARAMQNGAQAVQAPMRKRPDDDRRGGFRGPDGVEWWVATQ